MQNASIAWKQLAGCSTEYFILNFIC